MDFTINARPRPGLLLTGGTNTQRRTTDKCDVVRQVPESILNVTANAPSIPYCNTQGHFITQVKLTGSYTVPRVDVQVTAALQSQPGPEVASPVITQSDAYASWLRPQAILNARFAKVVLQLDF